MIVSWWGAMLWNVSHYGTTAQIHDIIAPESSSSPFSGNDWVNWANSDEGVVVESVHPLIKGNSFLEGQYLEKGDILRKIDYSDVYDAEVVDYIVSNAPPGKVLLFQVDRSGPLASGTGWKSLLIETAVDPKFDFTDSHSLWTIFPWILILGSFVSLISMLIIYPIIRSRLRTTWPLFAVISLSFLVFLSLLGRHLNLLVSTDFISTEVEANFLLIFMGFVLIHGVVAVFSRIKVSWMKILALPGLLVGIYFLYQVEQTLFGAGNPMLSNLYEPFILHFVLSSVMAVLLLSVIEKWRGRSRIDQLFHLLSLGYVGSLFTFYTLLPSAGSEYLVQSDGLPEWPMLLSFGAILIPMISATASQLKFGRVSVVLTSSIQYILFAGFAFLLYYLLHSTLVSLGIQFKYQTYLEISALLLVLLIFRFFYKANEGRLRKYVVLAQQERRGRIDRFVARISQYTSSQRLLDDLVEALSDYFSAQKVVVWMKDEPGAGGSAKIDDATLEAIYAPLQMADLFWARNRQMVVAEIPLSVETPLQASSFDFANPITVNDDIYGILLISRKNRGVYNLEDLEIISRIVQQTQLTLGVLHLLEREKLLMQKNYEANLTALRSQINPHFLFNTLNTISALIHDAPDDAEVAVEKLAFIFRYTLKTSSRNLVTLREEMDLVRTYLEIEQIRFGERLELHFRLDPKMMDVELPAFVIQTIIENSIKHGIGKIMGKGIVSIDAHEKDGFMECNIEDNGPGIDHSKITSSTGLNNITTRLQQIYQTKNLLYFENTGNGTRVTIKIPLQA